MGDTCPDPFSFFGNGATQPPSWMLPQAHGDMAGRVQHLILSMLSSVLVVGSDLVRWLVNVYLVVGLLLLMLLWTHSMVQYVRGIYAAATRALHREHDPALALIWRILFLLLSVLASLLAALLWPLWLPFVVVGLLGHMLCWAMLHFALFNVAMAQMAWREIPIVWRRLFPLTHPVRGPANKTDTVVSDSMRRIQNTMVQLQDNGAPRVAEKAVEEEEEEEDPYVTPEWQELKE